jgi:outer membrane protein OmpA-like peptidoglycan-associated protein
MQRSTGVTLYRLPSRNDFNERETVRLSRLVVVIIAALCLWFGTSCAVNGRKHAQPPAPPALACNVSPSQLMAGEPLTATVSATNFNPNQKLSYVWTTTGGKISGNAASVTVDTTGVAAGEYKISARIGDSSEASTVCSANFTLIEPPKHPPTIACSVDRTHLAPGQPANILCTGTNEDSRPLRYSWSSTAGRIIGNGETAILYAPGGRGDVTVTVDVADDRGFSASSSVKMSVQDQTAAPSRPWPPDGQDDAVEALLQKLRDGKTLVGITFDSGNATIRPESEPLLRDIAQALQADHSQHIYVDGYTDNIEMTSSRTSASLSALRSRAVVNWLKDHGVSTDQLFERPFGAAHPLRDNLTEAGRQANRRVEIVPMTPEMVARELHPPVYRAQRSARYADRSEASLAKSEIDDWSPTLVITYPLEVKLGFTKTSFAIKIHVVGTAHNFKAILSEADLNWDDCEPKWIAGNGELATQCDGKTLGVFLLPLNTRLEKTVAVSIAGAVDKDDKPVRAPYVEMDRGINADWPSFDMYTTDANDIKVSFSTSRDGVIAYGQLQEANLHLNFKDHWFYRLYRHYPVFFNWLFGIIGSLVPAGIFKDKIAEWVKRMLRIKDAEPVPQPKPQNVVIVIRNESGKEDKSDERVPRTPSNDSQPRGPRHGFRRGGRD